MKKFYILLITIFTTNIANAQWVQTSLNHGQVISLISSDSIIFACSWSGGIYVSSDNGNSWSALNNGLTNIHVRTLAISGNNFFAGTDGGVFISSNNGGSWTVMNNGLPANTIITKLAINDSNIFAGTYKNGVYLSSDNGNNWTAVNTGLTDTIIRSLAISGTSIFAGTNGGVFLSNNNGNSWAAINTGLTDTNIRSLIISGTNIFAGTEACNIFLSTNNGNNWIAANTGLTGVVVSSFAITGNNIFAGTAYSTAYGSGGVFLSTNNGSNWTFVNTGMADSVISLLIKDNYIFAGTLGGVWRRPLSDFGIYSNIKENTLNNNISIYPNPTKDNLTIETNLNTPQKLEISTLMGQTIYTYYIYNKATINTSAFANGVYILKIYSDKETVVRKIVKE